MEVEEQNIHDLFDDDDGEMVERYDDDDGGGFDDEAIEVPEPKAKSSGAQLELEDSGQAQASGPEDGTAKEVKVKRVIRNPMPKLNPERITGPRGIAALEPLFQDFQPKGCSRKL